MTLSVTRIQKLLLPGLRKLTGEYQGIPRQYSQVFATETSEMAFERTTEMRFLSLPQLVAEGGITPMDNGMGERFTYNQTHLEIKLGYAVTRKAIDDNQYKTQFRPSNLGLMDTFAEYAEIRGADILNTATTYDATIGGDGKALCDTAHPIDGDTVANRPSTDLALNENAIYSGAIQCRQFKNQAGIKKPAKVRKLLVPIQLDYVACRLTKSQLRPDTANNDVNAIYEMGVLPDGYMSMDYLTSATAWYLKTDQESLVYMERVAFETNSHVDPATGSLLVLGYERNSFGRDGYRGIWGSFPS